MADTPSIALGLLLVACCPAGALSNYLTGVARGSVAIERTQSGLARARAEGKALGRPRRLSEDAMSDVQGRLAAGETISAIAKAYSTSRQTIMRIRGAAGAKGL
jgi:putative DNA-invertase from lambdoid prophage Rac